MKGKFPIFAPAPVIAFKNVDLPAEGFPGVYQSWWVAEIEDRDEPTQAKRIPFIKPS